MTDKALHPNVRFRHKLYVVTIVAWLLSLLASAALGSIIGYKNGGATGAVYVVALAVVVNVLWVAPVLLVIRPYFRSLQYEIHSDEIIVRAGVVTKSVKHVPYRTVTNLKISRGPFDRLFGIGTLEVQTAGMSGKSGVEESLVGLEGYQEAYDHVAQTLRQFRGAMPATQAGDETSVEREPLLSAILDELRAIRNDIASA